MIVNVWLGIPEDDHNELNNRRGTENNIGPAKQFVDGQLDPDVVQRLYKTRTQGATTYHLWSVILDDSDGPIDQQINAFRQEFPAARVEGVWLPAGNMLGTELVINEVPNPAYVGAPLEIPNPDYQPDPELADYDPRDTIRNPAWVPEFLYEKTQVGTPAYEPSDQLINYMPDVGEPPVPATELTDVNSPMGWGTRVFI